MPAIPYGSKMYTPGGNTSKTEKENNNILIPPLISTHPSTLNYITSAPAETIKANDETIKNLTETIKALAEKPYKKIRFLDEYEKKIQSKNEDEEEDDSEEEEEEEKPRKKKKKPTFKTKRAIKTENRSPQPQRAGPPPDCRNFVNNGYCSYGDNCRFNHPAINPAFQQRNNNSGGNSPRNFNNKYI